MHYRADIDGLRALSVLLVIAFHAGIPGLGAGFIGVDVFFVISGFLITGLIHHDVQAKRFSFLRFYRRRMARLLPALVVTLAAILLFGLVHLDLQAYDNLGKEVFFAAFGAANILFAQGANYFVEGQEARLTIHLWSLGVEEQFYLVWPLALLALMRLRTPWVRWTVVSGLAAVSLGMADAAARVRPTEAYFLPHYRAFELLIGAAVALAPVPAWDWVRSRGRREAGAVAGLVLIAAGVVVLDPTSVFPGYWALLPCGGAALLLAAGPETGVARLLRWRPLVVVGLISYPLYLFHQPIIAAQSILGAPTAGLPVAVFAVTCGLGGGLAWLTYRFLERPIRRWAHEDRTRVGVVAVVAAGVAIVMIAGSGLFVAKSGGLPQRFLAFNPFAHEVAEQSASTFHGTFAQGFQVAPGARGRILFVGDSYLQQYVQPLATVLGIPVAEVEVASRGGCVLLKGADFKDTFADISCTDLRERLYASDKKYDIVVIGQNWSGYDADLLNATGDPGDPGYAIGKWTPFLDATLAHFAPLSERLLLLGPHPQVAGTEALQPRLGLSREGYGAALGALRVVNRAAMMDAAAAFARWQTAANTTVLFPGDIWCDAAACIVHDGAWSYFSDAGHISRASTAFVEEALRRLLDGTARPAIHHRRDRRVDGTLLRGHTARTE